MSLLIGTRDSIYLEKIYNIPHRKPSIAAAAQLCANLRTLADNYFKFSLQDILKRQIDLLEEKAIKNPYTRKSVNHQRQLVYGQLYLGVALRYS